MLAELALIVAGVTHESPASIKFIALDLATVGRLAKPNHSSGSSLVDVISFLT